MIGRRSYIYQCIGNAVGEYVEQSYLVRVQPILWSPRNACRKCIVV